MRDLTSAVALAGVILAGAIFGFFYAWVCSTMWGLDAADPRVAIAAMQAMNASVRNAVFAPAFFATPVVLGVAALLAWRTRRPEGATWLGGAALAYTLGALLPTALVNVPMNEALARIAVPSVPEDAARVWADFSPEWQRWNQLRTAACAAVLTFAALGFRALRRSPSDCASAS